jgi:hypothetical protein
MPVPAWPEHFPNVTVMTSVSKLYSFFEYEAAKAGNLAAARAVVLAAAREPKMRALAALCPKAILVPVRALERAGNNQLPATFADYFSHVTGLRVDLQIVQTNLTGHTGTGRDYRMAYRPSFDGPVSPGQSYLLLDDVVTMGGTLGELRAFIAARGGTVRAICTLAAAQFSAQIALTPKTKLALETTYDPNSLRDWRTEHNLYGGSVGALTEAEARWLLAAKTLDAARSRLAAQHSEQQSPGEHAGLRPALSHLRPLGQPAAAARVPPSLDPGLPTLPAPRRKSTPERVLSI